MRRGMNWMFSREGPLSVNRVSKAGLTRAYAAMLAYC